ncbi:hypothetical protein HPB50_008943 [Hyalomma asiaticum]|uniref:Uncharacterized protein n=1 Tax=Hyalomma asiaticum TaxID=266040 RepID=A0ACB7SX93_HYAAI|nr:hypothetical protein HPB50_008943 [Hyalomma asiaticum]
MSQTSDTERCERPQEESQGEGLFYDAGAGAHAAASLVEDVHAREQPSGGNEPCDNLQSICEEIRKIFSMLQEQKVVEEQYFSTIQETAGDKAVSRCFDDKRKVVMEIVSEINAALQRIEENEKMLDAIKAAVEATWKEEDSGGDPKILCNAMKARATGAVQSAMSVTAN